MQKGEEGTQKIANRDRERKRSAVCALCTVSTSADAKMFVYIKGHAFTELA